MSQNEGRRQTGYETEVTTFKGNKYFEVWRTLDGERDQADPIVRLSVYKAKMAIKFADELQEFVDTHDKYKVKQPDYDQRYR